MEITRGTKPFNQVDYFPLPNGKIDVFLHRNEVVETEVDNEGNESVVYVAEEVYFQVDKYVTKEYIEVNFDTLWDEIENPMEEPSVEERLAIAEDTINFLLGI